jgi:hypothetical protein
MRRRESVSQHHIVYNQHITTQHSCASRQVLHDISHMRATMQVFHNTFPFELELPGADSQMILNEVLCLGRYTSGRDCWGEGRAGTGSPPGHAWTCAVEG